MSFKLKFLPCQKSYLLVQQLKIRKNPRYLQLNNNSRHKKSKMSINQAKSCNLRLLENLKIYQLLFKLILRLSSVSLNLLIVQALKLASHHKLYLNKQLSAVAASHSMSSLRQSTFLLKSKLFKSPSQS